MKLHAHCPGEGGGMSTLTFVCYIGLFLALSFPINTNKFWHTPQTYVSISPYPQTYQDYTLQPMMLTKISKETV